MPIEEAIPAAIADSEISAPISLRINSFQGNNLRDMVIRQIGGVSSETSGISRENAIAGFIIASINAHLPTPIQQVGHTFNVSI